MGAEPSAATGWRLLRLGLVVVESFPQASETKNGGIVGVATPNMLVIGGEDCTEVGDTTDRGDGEVAAPGGVGGEETASLREICELVTLHIGH